MPAPRVTEVSSRRQLRQFVRFPIDLYRDCPQYVPALDSDQIRSLTKVSTLSYCEQKMWLAYDGKKVVGRICGIINPRYNERYGTRRARFGWFDTVDDFEVARALIQTAEDWARSRGMDELHGPLYYNTLGKQGMLVEGFENMPPFNCLYNFPYYVDFVERLGFEKECDWVQYRVPAEHNASERIQAIADRVSGRHSFHKADLRTFKKDPLRVREFFHMYSESFSRSVQNFIPFTDEEIDEEAASVMPFLDDRLCCILLDEDDEVAAFGIGFASISQALRKARGRLFPLGWLHLLRAMHNYETVDLMLSGSSEKWYNSGVSAVYHCTMCDTYRELGVKTCITNPQIETNPAAKVWESYAHEPFMRRRCYLKKI